MARFHSVAFLVTLPLLLLAHGLTAQRVTKIGFEETWALATDRSQVLSQLIPGTEDYYDYHCRHYQDTGALDKVPPLLRAWTERFGRNARVIRTENRQALLGYESDPATAMKFLQQRLGLKFDHARKVADAEEDLQSVLNGDLITAKAFTDRALRKHGSSLRGIRTPALMDLLVRDLDEPTLHQVLSRLRRVDLPGLPALIVRNLRYRRSSGFGSLAIHRNLLRDQLEECLRLRPTLRNEDRFVGIYLRRLLPSEDVDWRRDPAARLAYLERLESFTARLGSNQNSLKAHVLHHRIAHDLAAGEVDRARLLRYLRLPRKADYMRSEYLQPFRSSRGAMVDAGRSFATGLAAIGNDEPLVRRALMQLFRTMDSTEPFAESVDSNYLRRVFAETKILHGIGDMEQWYALLNDPIYYEKLKERVEINFAPTQREMFGATDAVTLTVDVKNVPKLLVKIFEINTFNYYRKLGREVDASINLDGLVANHEFSREYTEPALRRVRRTLELAQLEKPGVYVVELIGNGISSRAVIHKGELRFTTRSGAAGHVFTVRDAAGAKVSAAKIWFGGREYVADAQGEIVIPYSTQPKRAKIILQADGLCSLGTFSHQAERYAFSAGIHLERESLLGDREARILVRPSLQLNGRAISLKALENVTLYVRATNRDGVEATTTVRNFELFGDKESVHPIQVPPNLRKIRVSLQASIQNLSRGKREVLSTSSKEFDLNGIDSTPQTSCPLLGRTETGYVIDVLGKSGEPKAGRVVGLKVYHEDFTDPLEVRLKTDPRGRIVLGRLPGIEAIESTGLPRGSNVWALREAARTYPGEVHGVVGEVLRVPYDRSRFPVSTRAISLLEIRGGQPVRDAYDRVTFADGYLELRNLAAGDYELSLFGPKVVLRVRVTKGARKGDWALGRDRLLEIDSGPGVQVTGLDRGAEGLEIRLAGATAATRVHVVATRYLAPFYPFQAMDVGHGPGLRSLDLASTPSSYHAGREIGDEYRYILERRFAKKYPGNMLDRPGLLLNPWNIEEQAWSTAVGLGGGAGGRYGGPSGGRRGRSRKGGASGGKGYGRDPGTFANVGFLANGAQIAANLRPDAQGVVQVGWKDLGPGQIVHVLVCQGHDTVYRTVVRDENPAQIASRKLPKALDRSAHFTEQRKIEFVPKGGSAVVENARLAEAQTYDSLASVFRLFVTLNGGTDIEEFEFLLRWPELKPEERATLYEEHACHELHFFLYKKDPEFFRAVVRPYLANKAHKTFLDEWLLDRDLSRYLEPWAFGRLNAVEKILLARRAKDAGATVRRHIAELLELQPPDPNRLARLFDSAMGSGGLDKKSDQFGSKLRRLKSPAQKPGAAAPRKANRRGGRVASKRRPSRDRGEEKEGKAELDLEVADEAVEEEEVDEEAANKDKSAELQQLERRKQIAVLYRGPGQTQALAENNYRHRRASEQGASIVRVNAFWRDFAEHGNGPFVSVNVAEAARNFTEMVLALAVLDLPFQAGVHGSDEEGARVTLKAASPLLLVRKELVASEVGAEESPILVSQNYYRLDEPFRFEGNVRRDAYVRDEFLVDVAYGCRVVVTNPTSAPRELELLLQIPEGAVPVQGGFYTQGKRLALKPYATAAVEYAFYFPAPGTMPHYPVQVAAAGKLVAFAQALDLRVVTEPTKVDTGSWSHVSQSGTTEQVLAYLEAANLQRTDLSLIAWRMRDKPVFDAVIALLRKRHRYIDVLWGYGVRHGDADVVREFLRHQDRFVGECGVAFESPLLTIDPIERHRYEHLEYSPMFNARAHVFGKQHSIANLHFAEHYKDFLEVLGQRRVLDDADWMTVTYYLLLQDRIEEALVTFGRVRPERLPMRVQHDYMRAYLDMFTDGLAVARQVATRYQDYPVARWRKLFAALRTQLGEIETGEVSVVDPENRNQRQAELAAKQPTLDLKVEARRVNLRYRNMDRCEVRYYEMDVEFLFSTHPFVQQGAGSFAFIQPNFRETKALPRGQQELAFDLPEQFLNSNVLIEVRSGSVIERRTYYANSLNVQWMENYGQLRVTHAQTGKPLRTTYVKVFARGADGRVRFYKDGYTDLRGRFDYTSLSGGKEMKPRRFSVLVLSDQHGAEIRELAPPTQ